MTLPIAIVLPSSRSVNRPNCGFVANVSAQIGALVSSSATIFIPAGADNSTISR